MYFSDALLLSFPKKQKPLSLYLSTFPCFFLKFLEFGTTWEQGRSRRIMRPNSRFDRFIVLLLRITLLLFQISLIFLSAMQMNPQRFLIHLLRDTLFHLYFLSYLLIPGSWFTVSCARYYCFSLLSLE